jgi:methylglutaconyl-CoA hydratase
MTTGNGESEVERERHGGIEIWRLNRPDRHNALSSGMVAALDRTLAQAEFDDDLRVVVVVGAGTRAFCAGADLHERRSMSDAQVRAFLGALGGVVERIDRFPRPMIAAINGAALGGGLELALACDLRVMALGAMLALPEVTLGVIPGAGGTQRLPRLIGEARAKELILRGRRVQAAEALALGMVHGTAEDALASALELARELEQGAPIAVAAALRAIDGGRDVALSEGLSIERECYEATLASEDRREALSAFAERRRPQFRGR